MNKGSILQVSLVISVFLLGSCKKESKPEASSGNDAVSSAATSDPQGKQASGPGTVSLYSTGFNNPRGLEFGPDGNLYVAEAGTGGNALSVNICPLLQVAPPFGPYLGSTTGGRISRVSSSGIRTTLVDNLPSSTSANGDLMGVGDVAFIGNTLYALLAGAGCSHGVPSVPNGVVRINPNGSFTVIADLGSWQVAHPVAHPEPSDFEPEGVWYSMINVNGELYALEPNHGDLVKVTTGGAISRVTDISASQGHIVPTALAYHGNFYVGNLNKFPTVDGGSSIYKINPSGNVKVSETGFSNILGLVFDSQSTMYVLESTTGNPFPTPFTGRVIRVKPNGDKEVVASGLSLATGLAMGPDGNLYVSTWGFGPHTGEIMKVTIN
jgi:hypothetical protein